MNLASRLNHHLRRRGVERSEGGIYAVVLDGDTAHALTEGHLDAWWQALSPEQKAEVYERELGDGEARCRFCGCTNRKPCMSPDPCSWLDANHTVCSAPLCSTRHHASMFDDVFGYRHTQPAPDVLFDGRTSHYTRQQIDHFLRSGQWLSIGELDQAKSWDNPSSKEAHVATL